MTEEQLWLPMDYTQRDRRLPDEGWGGGRIEGARD